MKKVPVYYKIYKCIQSATAQEHLNGCERMIFHAASFIQAEFYHDLVQELLSKRITLLTTQYPVHE